MPAYVAGSLVNSGVLSAVSSYSPSVNTGTGSDRLLVVKILQRSFQRTVTSITYNGVSLTQAGSTASNGSIWSEIWYLANPASGSNTLSITWDTALSQAIVYAEAYTGIAGTSPLDQTNTGTGNSAAPSASVTPTEDNELIVGCIIHERHTALAVGSGETSLADDDNGAWVTSTSYAVQTTAAAQAVDWTAGGADIYAMSVATFKESGGASPQTVSPNHIASTASVPSPTVTPQPATVSPSSIASTASAYGPELDLNVLPGTVASAAQVHEPTVAPQAITVTPDSIASTAIVHEPTVAVSSSGAISAAAIDSLVSWWALDETSGTRYDSHGDNDLTDNNSVSYAAGKQANAADIVDAATDTFLSVASNSTLQTGNIDFTWCAWIRPDRVTGTQTIVNKQGINSSATDYILRLQGGTAYFYIGGSTFPAAVGPAGMSAGTWYFVVAWHNAANDTVNIQLNNGSPASTATLGVAPSGTSTANLGIGRWLLNSTDQFDGLIDEVCFFKSVLSADDRAALYNSGDGITYAEAVGSAVVIRPDPIASTATVYSPTVTPQATTVALDSISSTAQVHEPTVSPQAVTLLPGTIGSVAVVYEPTLVQGAANQTLLPSHISSTAAVYGPAVAPDQTLLPGHIASTASVYNPSVVGEQVVLPGHISSTAEAYGPRLDLSVLPGSIASGATVYEPVATAGAAYVYPEFISSEELFYNLQVGDNSQYVYLSRIGSVSRVHGPFMIRIPARLAVAPARKLGVAPRSRYARVPGSLHTYGET